MTTIRPIHFAAALAALALAACNPPSTPAPASNASAPPPAATLAIAAPATQATSAALPGDHATTAHYEIAIDLPTLPTGETPLAAALRTTANDAKREFLQALPAPKQSPQFANRQYQLLLDFKVAANTARFTSVRETGMEGTGGAHPIPVEAAFVFDRKAGTLITLDDLFTDAAAARKALAAVARDTLLKKFTANAPKPGEGSPAALREWKVNMLQMLDDGTKPTRVNYSLFVVRAGATPGAPSPGLTLIFPPYQVAPYAAGTQTVEVPANVFTKFLKPAYRGAFATQ